MTDNSNNEIWVFLSHSHLDYEKVRLVRNFLEEEGFRPLMFFLKCLEKEKYNELTKTLIKEEIDSRQRFILCQSDNSKGSDWVDFEVNHIKDRHRPYEVVDLDWPESKIELRLKKFKERSTVFLSYPRRCQKLAMAINQELKAREFRTFIDVDNIKEGVDYSKAIENNIVKAVQFGYVLVIVDDHLNKESLQYKEIVIALKAAYSLPEGYRIIPVWAFQQSNISSFMQNNPDISNIIGHYQGIDISGMDIHDAAQKLASQLNDIDIRFYQQI